MGVVVMMDDDAMTTAQGFAESSQRIATRLQCARGHICEHRGGVTVVDLDALCWCGAPRSAATVYAVSGTVGRILDESFTPG